ncbi:MAG TPA: signal peptidase I, partial [Saprospiraceae bacterium]|nr:signal peptidase I [Saprospiraceae bacterium]
MSILIFLVVSYLLLCYSLSLIFKKANIEASKAWIPGVNFAEWCKLVGRSPNHAWWLLFPIVNLFIFVGLCIDLVKSFGKMSFWDSALSVIYAPLSFWLIAQNPALSYIEPAYLKEKEFLHDLHLAQKAKDWNKVNRLRSTNKYARGAMREWVESIIFAVFAAAFIRMFLIEAYVIPTPSMEGSLKVGDFLFVSKAHYGIRTPMTVAMIPLLHNRIPKLDVESYFKKPSLPYFRLPAVTEVKRNDPFVFNWPVGDSVYVTPTRSWTAFQAKTQPEAAAECKGLPLIVRPLDKKDHYIKRCVGLPGDSLQIINRQLYINGREGQNPEHLQYLYQVSSTSTSLSRKKLEEWGVNTRDPYFKAGYMFLDAKQLSLIQAMGTDVAATPVPYPDKNTFPHDPQHFPNWTFDNFGPIWIPKKGTTVSISLDNIALYSRIISVYENNTLAIEGDQIKINNQPASSYTFKQDYYWAMGDNRHNSEDSRAWGFVPHDHVVG